MKLQEKIDRSYNTNQRISGVSGEVSEMEEFLMAIPEARDDLDIEKNAKITAQFELYRRNKAVGTVLVRRSFKRWSSVQASDDHSLA